MSNKQYEKNFSSVNNETVTCFLSSFIHVKLSYHIQRIVHVLIRAIQYNQNTHQFSAPLNAYNISQFDFLFGLTDSHPNTTACAYLASPLLPAR